MLMMPRRRPPSEKCAQLAAAFARAETAWHSVAEEWRTKAAAVDFASERRAILALKAQLDAVSVERAAWLQALAKPVPEAEQRLTHLAQFRIEDAGLYNIGAARMAVLRSWGVETAAETDEEMVGSIPGFGRNLKERLVNWREGLEQRFHFEPTASDAYPCARALAPWYTKLDIFAPARGRPGTLLLSIVLSTLEGRERANDDFRIDDARGRPVSNVSDAWGGPMRGSYARAKTVACSR